MNLSLLEVGTRTSYPLITEQLVREAVKESAPKAVKEKRAKRGRPKGSANQNRKDVELSPFQTQLQGCIRAALELIGLDLGIVYFVYDGALGNNAGLQAVTQTGLHLISKLRHDSTLYFPYAGGYSGKGRRRKYGERLTPETLTEAHLKAEATEKDIRTRVYQAQAWHKNFPELLNVVVIVKTNLKTGRSAKVLLFSDDLALAAETLIEYYSLRFQIDIYQPCNLFKSEYEFKTRDLPFVGRKNLPAATGVWQSRTDRPVLTRSAAKPPFPTGRSTAHPLSMCRPFQETWPVPSPVPLWSIRRPAGRRSWTQKHGAKPCLVAPTGRRPSAR